MNHNGLDTVEYRKALWEKEYQDRKELPSTRSTNPSRALVKFFESHPEVKEGRALDLGSGNGRNSFFLVEKGFKVVGIELSEVAVGNAKEESKARSLDNQITFLQGTLGNPVEQADQSFDLIVDMMVMHSMTSGDREVMIGEINRLLKPGGMFAFHTIAADSPAAVALIESSPGPEENSYRFEVDGDIVTEKAFTKKELQELFEHLELVEFNRIEESTKAFGGEYDRVYYSGVFQKN